MSDQGHAIRCLLAWWYGRIHLAIMARTNSSGHSNLHREHVAAFGGGRRPIIATKLAGYMDDGGRIPYRDADSSEVTRH